MTSSRMTRRGRSVEPALDAGAAMAESESIPDALCPELGRRLLLAQLQ
jgi:hypothetical protein